MLIRRFPKTLLALGLGLALSAPAMAQGPKIAVIDTEQILLASNTGKKALADLKKLQEQKETEGKNRSQEIKDLQTKLNDGRLSLAADKIGDMEKQLEDKVIALKRFQDDANRELGKRRDEILASVDQKVMPVINQLGKEQGYTLIFRKFESGLIYADEAVDITGQVIQRLDGGGGAAQGSKGK